MLFTDDLIEELKVSVVELAKVVAQFLLRAADLLLEAAPIKLLRLMVASQLQ